MHARLRNPLPHIDFVYFVRLGVEFPVSLEADASRVPARNQSRRVSRMMFMQTNFTINRAQPFLRRKLDGEDNVEIALLAGNDGNAASPSPLRTIVSLVLIILLRGLDTFNPRPSRCLIRMRENPNNDSDKVIWTFAMMSLPDRSNASCRCSCNTKTTSPAGIPG